MREEHRLRGHHIYCTWFIKPDFVKAHGPEMEAKTKSLLNSPPDSLIRVVEGVDDICRICPHIRGERCANPSLDDQEMRNFDTTILKALKLNYGQTFPWREWKRQVEEKAPLAFCQQCKWRASCSWGVRG